MHEFDIVVVSYNSRDQLRTCVEPLAGQPGVQVFVVDSASSDGCLDTIADLPVTTVPLTENRGFGFACNVGWRRGTAPFVVFLNPDATIDVESLGRLADVASDERVGAVAPRIVEPDGSLDWSLRRFPRLRTTYAQALFLHRLFPRADWTDELIRDANVYDRPGTPDWASGACLLLPRPVLERLGGFDDGFFLYAEDLDLCRRVWKAGLELRYEPTAIARHEGGASAPRTTLLPVRAASRVRYTHLHDPPTTALLQRLGLALSALTHIAVGRGGAPARRGHARALARALSPRPRMDP